MIATLLLWYFAVCGVLANLAAVGVWLFVWRLPEAELDDSPLDVVAKPSNVRVVYPPSVGVMPALGPIPADYEPPNAALPYRNDEGAVRVDWPAWVAVVGLVAVMALAGWAS